MRKQRAFRPGEGRDDEAFLKANIVRYMHEAEVIHFALVACGPVPIVLSYGGEEKKRGFLGGLRSSYQHSLESRERLRVRSYARAANSRARPRDNTWRREISMEMCTFGARMNERRSPCLSHAFAHAAGIPDGRGQVGVKWRQITQVRLRPRMYFPFFLQMDFT